MIAVGHSGNAEVSERSLFLSEGRQGAREFDRTAIEAVRIDRGLSNPGAKAAVAPATTFSQPTKRA